MILKKKHEKEIYEYYGSEKEYTNSYYKGLAEKLSDQKFELIRLYLNACLQSIGKNTDVKTQVYDSVLVFIKKEFEDIETILRLEISSELKNKFDWLRIDGKVDEKFNNPILKFNLILLSKFKRIQRYVDDKLKVEFKNVIEKKESPSSKKTKKEGNIFRHDGATWTVRYNGNTKTIKHTKGMDYIEFLLRHQEQKIHSMKLYQMMSGIVPDVDKRMSKTSPERIESDEGLHVDGKDAFELVDQKDIDSVKNTIKQLEDEHPQAMMENNSVRENEISIKLDKLNDYLSKCTYKGKIRTTSGATERMRVSIYMAIKTAKNNIKKHHKELFNHLNKFITTGTSISYSPDSPVSWFQDR